MNGIGHRLAETRTKAVGVSKRCPGTNALSCGSKKTPSAPTAVAIRFVSAPLHQTKALPS